MRKISVLTVLVSGFWTLACGSDTGGEGELNLYVNSEGASEIPAGSDEEDIQDGWAVTYEKYVVNIGQLKVGQSPSDFQSYQDSMLVDLSKQSTTGRLLKNIVSLPEGRLSYIGYEVGVFAGSTVDPSVSKEDATRMVDDGLSYLIAGYAEKDGKKVSFEIPVSEETVYVPCSDSDGTLGTVISPNAKSDVFLTVHEDHIFFNAFPEGGEGSVKRLAGWIDASDSDQDGVLTVEEMKAAKASDVLTSSLGYSFSGAPFAINTVWDFVRAQLNTQGHFQVEGPCVWSLKDSDAGN